MVDPHVYATQQLGASFATFKPHSVKTQVVRRPAAFPPHGCTHTGHNHHGWITNCQNQIKSNQSIDRHGPAGQVSGVNYKCKVDVGGDQFCHVTVHQPLPHTKEPAKVKEAMCSGCG